MAEGVRSQNQIDRREDRVVAYLSHSYRPEDRAVNMAVWRPLNDAGVIFTVDPPSKEKRPMDVTFLERMMQRSDCFVAIVPIRPREKGGSFSTWSPYQEFECRLAIRANKPRLIVVERGIDMGPLSEDEPHCWFERSPFRQNLEFNDDVTKFVEHARSPGRTRQDQTGYLPKTGVLRWTPSDGRWERLSEGLRRRSLNIKILEVDERTEDHALLDQARDMSVVVADVNPAITPVSLIGLLHGAAVPVFRTCLIGDDEDETEKMQALGLADPLPGGTDRIADQLRLPLLFRGYRVDERVAPVKFWKESSIDAAIQEVSDTTEDYRKRERLLEGHENASAYFLSLQGNRVFISSPSDLNQRTMPLKPALEFAGMPAFHYKVDDPNLRVGANWRESLRTIIRTYDLLLAYASTSYWESQECVYEMREALRRWERHQFLIAVCVAGPLPPLPQFLARYQVKRLPNGDREARSEELQDVVGMVRQQFANDPQREQAARVDTLARLAEHGLDLSDEKQLHAILGPACGLGAQEVESIGARVLASQNRAAELVRILSGAVGIEKFGASALGRLCFHLRRLERDRRNRTLLTSQFSELRLFPNLHDIDAWNRRRKRKQDEVRFAPDIPRASFEAVTALSGESASALDVVKRLGTEIGSKLQPRESGRIANDAECRVAVVGTMNDLMLPAEWAVLPGMPDALARIRPVFRQITRSNDNWNRDSIEDMFNRAEAGPPRVLLFGYGTPDLPNVSRELDEIKEVFDRCYAEREWPDGLTDIVRASDASAQALCGKLANSDYDILHICGHAGWNGSTPAIRVADTPENREWVTGSELGEWLRDSDVRFVYLSCCAGAAIPLQQQQLAGWQQSLCQQVLQAGVPEVAAYVWPVSDERSVPFTRRFYERFLMDFDGPEAMYVARRYCEDDNPLWAGSVLVKQ